MPEYIDRMIRAEDKATFVAVAQAVGLLDGEGQPVPGAHVDVLGTLYSGGTWDDEGAVTEPPTPIPGWHVNLRIDADVLPGWAEIEADWLDKGEPGTPHSSEHSVKYQGVELITGGVQSPRRIWA